MKKNELAIAFGLRIRTLRKEKGLSQEDFAALCDFDRTYISGIERGTRNPSLNAIGLISKALGEPIAHIFDGV